MFLIIDICNSQRKLALIRSRHKWFDTFIFKGLFAGGISQPCAIKYRRFATSPEIYILNIYIKYLYTSGKSCSNFQEGGVRGKEAGEHFDRAKATHVVGEAVLQAIIYSLK